MTRKQREILLAGLALVDPRTAAKWLDGKRVHPLAAAALASAQARVERDGKALLSSGHPESAPVVARPPIGVDSARKARARNRTAVELDSSWNSPQETTLRACGRDPRAENAAFIAHHEAKGTLSASWKASRTTWVLNVQKGYGAPARQTPPGLVAHAAQKGMSPDSPAIERPEHRAYRPKSIEVAPVGTAGEASAKLMASLRGRP